MYILNPSLGAAGDAAGPACQEQWSAAIQRPGTYLQNLIQNEVTVLTTSPLYRQLTSVPDLNEVQTRL